MHSKFQSLEIKMEKQSRHRKNERDGKMSSHEHLINNDDTHKTCHNAYQQPMQNCQGQKQQQQHLQYKQHQQHYQQQHQQHYQQQHQQHHQQQHQQHQHQQQQHQQQPQPSQQQFFVPPYQFQDQRRHQHYYPVQQACCHGNAQGQELEQKQDQKQHQQINQDKQFVCPKGSNLSQYWKTNSNTSKQYQPSDCHHHVQSNRCSHVHVPLPRNAQMHLPSTIYKDDIESKEAAGDRILFKNPIYTTESSIGINDADACEADCSRHTSKETFDHLESARALCEAAGAHFKAKYGDNDSSRSDDESTTGDSKVTHNSQCTVISGKSGSKLRAMVYSQIELQEAVNQSISDLNGIKENMASKFKDYQRKNKSSHFVASSDDGLPNFQFEENHTQRIRSQQGSLPTQQSNRAPSSAQPSNYPPQPIPSTESEFAVSVDDIVNARVISPMMRKIQRMYLNNLREEMAIMEDLERVPQLVSEVYKNAAQQELLKKYSSSSK